MVIVMNIKQYKEKKAKGLAEIVKAGGGYAFTTKVYSVDDGNELTPEIADYDMVIADVEALRKA